MFNIFSGPNKLGTFLGEKKEKTLAAIDPKKFTCYILFDLYHCKFNSSDNVVGAYENIKAFITRYLNKINLIKSIEQNISFRVTLFNYAPDGLDSSMQSISDIQSLSLVSLSNRVVSFANKAYINTIMLSHVVDEMCDSDSFDITAGCDEKQEFMGTLSNDDKVVCIVSSLSVIEDVGVSLNLNNVPHILAIYSDQDFRKIPSFIKDAVSWQSVRLSNNLQQHVLKSPTKSGDDRPEQDQVALEHLKQEMVERLRRESAVQLAEHKRLLDQQYVPKTTRIASALKACVQQPSSQAHFLPQPRKWANAGDAILSGKYTFHDYESGVFFTTFLETFTAHIALAFRVSVVDVDKMQESERSQKGSAMGGSVGSGEQKLPIFRINLTGTKADISAARDYLDSLNNRTLSRHPVHFPRADARKYNELLQHKAAFDSKLREFRLGEAAKGDPMGNTDGAFVSMRLKPSVHVKGVSRMNFPCDVTVTVCGPIGNEEQRSSVRAIEQFFSELPSGYETASVVLSALAPIAKQLTVRSSREDFVRKHDLASVRWLDESFVNGRNTVKIWARTPKLLNTVVELLLSQGGCLLTSTSRAIKLGNPQSPLRGEQEEHLEHLHQRGDFLGSFTGGLSDSADSSLGSCGGGGAASSQGSPERFSSFAPDQQTIVEWPNASMRYIFLGEPQKSTLNDIVAYFRSQRCVTIASPYRDKHNPLSCMRIASSSREAMLEASGAIRGLLATSLRHVCTVRLTMLDRQRAAVTADELLLIKEIQGDAGVHALLDPSRDDLESCISTVDLRLPFLEEDDDDNASRRDPELIRVVADPPPGRFGVDPVRISVLLSRNADEGWSFSRRSKVLLMVNAIDLGLSPDEATKLNSGDVLQHTEPSTARTMLTVRPSSCNGSAQEEADSFVLALIRGLSQAEMLGYGDVVVLAPRSVASLPTCARDLLQSLTIETCVRFANFYATGTLRHIYCIDLEEGGDEDADDVICAEKVGNVQGLEFNGRSLSEISPACGSQMAASLLLLLGSTARGYGISLETCNIPLPRASDAEPLLQGSWRISDGPNGSPYTKRGASSIVIRGLARGVAQAVRRVKIIAQRAVGKDSYSTVAQQNVKVKKG